jgi:ubiquinone/menaquinone biosynthesis C-methylase UbiE
LDLGCGNGRYYNIIKENGGEYLGVDNSAGLIKIAQEKYGQENFLVMDGLKLVFPDNHFDKIYSIAVLHHIPSKELRLDFLKQAKRVLKKDGLLALTTWRFKRKKEKSLLLKYSILKLIGKSKMDFRDILEPWADKTKRYYHCFAKRELAGLARKAGLKIVKVGVVSNGRGNRNNYYLVAQKV